MEITVSGRHLEITPAIREYASDKVAKLPRYFDRVQLISIVADKRENHTFEVEVFVDAEGHDRFVGKTIGPDLYAGIDACVDKLERQLTDHKEKVRQRKGKTSMSGFET
jgi:putative sigma-54 modulation protein